MNDLERRDSRKRRRLSDRRRVFGRIGLSSTDRRLLSAGSSATQSRTGSWSTGSQAEEAAAAQQVHSRDQSPMAAGSSSLSADRNSGINSVVSMKIQFHITLAPEHKPLILTTALNPADSTCPLTSSPEPAPQTTTTSSHHLGRHQKSTESIGDQIHQRLSRQSTLSTRRRNQLLAMHNQQVAVQHQHQQQQPQQRRAGSTNQPESAHIQSEDNIAARSAAAAPSREPGVRSSTISGLGTADEATERFLASAAARKRAESEVGVARAGSLQLGPAGSAERDHIYFKRDGQRFGHEFTLKLAVERTYRCLLKVRPLIPIQGISIHGHQVLFVDCSSPSSSTASSPASSSNLRANHWHLSDLSSAAGASGNQRQRFAAARRAPHLQSSPAVNQHHHRLLHAQTTGNLYELQQSQMLRHFAASHCAASSSSPHLGGQLIYMFDWPASRFEANKNKARTEVQAMLRFKNGQLLALPLQVKFYQAEQRQHLSWGSRLHFIDYDCAMNALGQMRVERIQYY